MELNRAPASLLRRYEIPLVVLMVSIITLFYYWSTGLGGGPRISQGPTSYYNLQAEGFRLGQLHAAVEPNPGLLALPDPYDPVANAPFRMHDMTFWQGRYYLYFGAAPVILVFLPFRLLTGYFISEPTTVALLNAIGLIMAASVIVVLRKRFFGAVPPVIFLALIAGLGLGSPILFLTQLPQFYQVPIACAHALLMAGIFCITKIFLVTKPASSWWLVVGGTFMGLTLAARPNYLLAMPLLLLPVWWVVSGGLLVAQPRSLWLRPAMLAFSPVVAVGLALLIYNALRFSNPFEFGMRYQLAGRSFVNFTPLSIEYFIPHFLKYAWQQVWWLPYFPFVETGIDAPFGIFRYNPLIWLGLAFFLPGSISGSEPHRRLRWLAGFLLGVALCNLGMDSIFFFEPELRYVSDFAPTFMLLGALGALQLTRSRNRMFIAAALAGIAASVFMVLAVYAQRMPETRKPAALAVLGNRLASLTDSFSGRGYGGIKLDVVVPEKPAAAIEPLFQTGYIADRCNWLQIHYLENNRAQLGFFHAGLGELLGNPFPIPSNRHLELTVFCSAFLPPSSHPLFSGWSVGQIFAARKRLTVLVNKTEVLGAELECYPSRPADLMLGKRGFGDHSADPMFSGTITKTGMIPPRREEPTAREIRAVTGVLELKLRLPALGTGYEPLLAAGEPDRGQLLYLIYGPNHTVQFALDTVGQKPRISRPVKYNPVGPPSSIRVWLGAWLVGPAALPGDAGPEDGSPQRRFYLSFEGEGLFNEDHQFFPGAASPTGLGWNRVQSGAASAEFTGRIFSVTEQSLETLPRGPARRALN